MMMMMMVEGMKEALDGWVGRVINKDTCCRMRKVKAAYIHLEYACIRLNIFHNAFSIIHKALFCRALP